MTTGEYLRGLNWVMAYYYAGCASWTWYYPYFYAPLASDLITVPEGTAAAFALGALIRDSAAHAFFLPSRRFVILCFS